MALSVWIRFEVRERRWGRLGTEGELAEALEGGDELGRPRPGLIEAQDEASAGADQTAGCVPQRVSQSFRFSFG